MVANSTISIICPVNFGGLSFQDVQVKRPLWGGKFWSDGNFASTVGKHGDEDTFSNYGRKQGKEYEKLHAP